MDHRHPDLADNILYPGLDGFRASELLASGETFEDAFQESFITEDTPHDGIGEHSTIVAGTAAAVANGIGGRGVAYNAQLVPLATNAPDDDFFLPIEGIVASGVFAVLGPDLAPGGDDRAPGTDPETGPYVHIVNMSWGGDGYGRARQDIVDYMLSHGIVLVAAAGNTPTEGAQFPAWTTGVVNVAATTASNERTVFSNRGLHLDVAAPGELILSTTTRACVFDTPDGSSCTPEDDDYILADGTSFSSPATAGVAAMILEAAADHDNQGNITGGLLSAAQVGHILRETALKPDSYDRTALGAGIVDAEAAVARALENDSDPVEDGGSLVVNAVLASDPEVVVPDVGLTLIPHSGDNPVEYTQTSNGSLFTPPGQGLFQQLDAGTYTLQASGPFQTVFGGEAATAETTVDLTPGSTKEVQIKLNLDPFDDPFEPNATEAQAAKLDGSGVSVRASFFDKGRDYDTDVYALPVSGSESYRVNVESAVGTFDSVLTITSEDGTVLAENDDNQAFTSDSLVTFTAPDDGSVFITVTEVSGTPSANSPFILYDLDIATFVGGEEEPNGSSTAIEGEIDDVDVSDAQSIPPGSALDASLTDADTDIFAVEVAAGERVVADIETVESGEPDTLLAIYNADGEQVAFNDDYTGQNSRTSFTADTGGTYYVLVTAWDSNNPENASLGDYGLSVTSTLNP